MISLVIVNYRSAALAIEAIASARRSCASQLQTIVVDNSCDEDEVRQLRAHADLVIASPSNRGYGGAVNDARKHVEGSVMLIANADVAFAADAIDRLVRSLVPGVGAAGPALYWDDAHEWILPPADSPTLSGKLDEALASRMESWHQRRDVRRTRARLAFWALKQTTAVPAISGAVMAIPTMEFDAAGGFDERFALYFEETDLLRRLRRRGLKILYVPEARCRHIYNQSAGSDGERAAKLYDASERLYFEKWYGSAVPRLIASLGRPSTSVRAADLKGPLAVSPGEVLIEASPLAGFSTAAGHFPRSASVEVPQEVWEAYRAPVLYLRSVELASGRIAGTWARKQN
ncbi:MAG: glycosyltransferase [Thermoanaerobaculia bacterium]|nr:glycosyltransferase [Thermoanaerobaculia bacterium]